MHRSSSQLDVGVFRRRSAWKIDWIAADVISIHCNKILNEEENMTGVLDYSTASLVYSAMKLRNVFIHNELFRYVMEF